MSAALPLWQHGEIAKEATVDEDRYDELADYIWHLTLYGYAARCTRKADGVDGGYILMHRQLCGLRPGDGRVVHHYNEDKLDNRRGNLVALPRGFHGILHPRSYVKAEAEARALVAHWGYA